MNIIEIKNLTKEYRPGVKAFDSINLEIKEGEIFGFIGPNGAGKTTTIKILLDLTFPTSGSAAVFGNEIKNTEYKRKTGYLPEEIGFYEFMKAGEFLEFLGAAIYVTAHYNFRILELSTGLNGIIK